MSAPAGQMNEERYIPAAGRPAFTGFYDTISDLTMREGRWHPPLADSVLEDLPSGGRIADIGTGTGRFSIEIANRQPDLAVIGIDGDDEALAIAAGKPGAAAVDWRPGLADALPLESDSVDRVVMTLLLHHLGPKTKASALREAKRVLVAGGRLHVGDWGRPNGGLARAGFSALQLLDGFENTRDHGAGRLPGFIVDAGFSEPVLETRISTLWGTVEVLRATA